MNRAAPVALTSAHFVAKDHAVTDFVTQGRRMPCVPGLLVTKGQLCGLPDGGFSKGKDGWNARTSTVLNMSDRIAQVSR